MSVVEDLIGAVAASPRIDAGTKAVLTTFLREGGEALTVLAPEAFADMMRQLAGANRAAAIDTVAQSLTAAQVVTVLGTLAGEMEQAADSPAASREASAGVIGALESAAMTAIAQAIIAAL